MAICIAHVVASQETHGGQYDISKIISDKIDDWREKAINAGRPQDSWGRYVTPLQAIANLKNPPKTGIDEMSPTEQNAQAWIEHFFRSKNTNG
jgi:hypothetical protein